MKVRQSLSDEQFVWTEFDATRLLPPGWDAAIDQVARQSAVARTLTPTSVTSREADRTLQIPVLTVGGRQLRNALPWLYDLYRGTFRDLAQKTTGEPVSVARDDRYAINLNIQQGLAMRYEAHVDSNPIEGLLYVTTHTAGAGGELVVSRRHDAWGVEAIIQNCIRIEPVCGKLIFFDARKFPHYVAPLARATDRRIVLAMNFYTPSCPETARPRDLNRHLFGED